MKTLLLLAGALAIPMFAVDAPRPWPKDPFLPVTAERIDALPAAAQPAWRAYWEKSAAQATKRPAPAPADRSSNAPVSRAPLGGSYSVGLRLDASYAWYANEPARQIADRVVAWQAPTGGWSKEGNYTRDRLPADDRRDTWSAGTFDNNATVSELRFLARVISYDNAVPPARLNPWKESFLRGLDYVFAAQYPNGGYPQVYPLVGGYHDSITLNDDGYVQILQLLRDIGNREPEYTFVPEEIAARARERFQRGLECILATQLKSPEGRRTVWCQQYDALTLQPCSARNFEPAAECARESAGIVKFLMSRPAPSPEIIAAVEDAMQWFADRVIRDKYWDRNAPAGVDLEDRPGAPDLWARFYEFNTGKPVFGDRDRRIYYSVAQISFERRKGYTWFCTEPAELVPYHFYWQHKVARTAPPPTAAKETSDAPMLPASAATVTAPLVLQDGAIAQPQQTELAEGGRAVFSFAVEKAGDYLVHAVVNAPGEDANSFFVNCDASPEAPLMIWDMEPTHGFEERIVSWRGNGDANYDEFTPKVFRLTAGEHKLIIVGREPVQLKSVSVRPAAK